MEFNFNNERSDAAIIHDKVYAAMETGNTGQARLIVAEFQEAFPAEVAAVITDVQADYGIRL